MPTATQTLALALVVALSAAARPAEAQEAQAGTPTGIGLGIQGMLAGPAGPSLTYQAPGFHIDAIFTFDRDLEDRRFFVSRDRFGLAGRFFWELHSGAVSDFSLGLGLGIEDDERANRSIDIHLEGAAKIRAFIVPNVALSAAFGLAIEIRDRDDDRTGVGFIGDPFGVFGITYFFF